MNELIKIESIPAKVSVNFEQIKKELQNSLKRYDGILVTEDTLADGKKLVTELNKRAGEFKRIRIDESKKLKAPISLFEDQMKELEGICQAEGSKLKVQVEVFEVKKLKKCRVLIVDYLYAKRIEKSIHEDFQLKHDIDSLVKLTAMTKSGTLTKSTVQNICAFLDQEIQLQFKINGRLEILKGYSLNAGLDSALVRENVAGFLFFESNQDYMNKLDSLIASEKRRQEEARAKQAKIAEDAARVKLAEEQRQQIEIDAEAARVKFHDENSTPEIIKEEIAETAAHADENDHLAEAKFVEPTKTILREEQAIGRVGRATRPNMIEVTVVATFKVAVPKGVKDIQITTRLEKILSDAGITSLESIEVNHA